MYRVFGLVLGISLAIVSFSQFLDCPESIVYDQPRDRYIISNWGDGSIVQMDSTGEMSYFSTELPRIAGLHIKDNTLFVASNEEPYMGITAFNLNNDSLEYFIHVPEAELPNDIATDTCGNLYFSDYWGNKLYKVNLAERSYRLYWDTDFNMPNGIIFDDRYNRLIVTSVNEPPRYPLYAIDLADSSISLVANTYLGGIDGLAFDFDYRLYVSIWATNSIERFPADFLSPPERFSAPHISPADIYFDRHNSLLCIPNFGDSTLSFVPVIPESTSDNLLQASKLVINASPNPFNSRIEFKIPDNALEIEIFDLKGNVIHYQNLGAKNKFAKWTPSKDINSGVYLAKFAIENGSSTIKKIQYLK